MVYGLRFKYSPHHIFVGDWLMQKVGQKEF